MTTEAQERVSRGATMLDEHWPGWAEKIDPAQIDIGTSHRCILGQLSDDGVWITARSKLPPVRAREKAREYGFVVPHEIRRNLHGVRYWRIPEGTLRETNAAWMVEVRKRQHKPPPRWLLEDIVIRRHREIEVYSHA